MTVRIGVDTGGTFTDLVGVDDETGEVMAVKSPSTPSKPVDAITSVIGVAGFQPVDVSSFVHGTTVGTNALIERKGANVAYLTTKGFEDTPYIQRINRKTLYNLRWVKPKPLVRARKNCIGINERLNAKGETLRPLDRMEVERVCEQIKNSAVEAVAACLLFSYVNPEHEVELKKILEEKLPGTPLSISHEVAPIWREYERGSTTIADAYLKPLFHRYINSLEEGLRDKGMNIAWTVMKSNGGVMLSHAAADNPVQTLMSGPAGGMIASQYFAELLGQQNVLTIDMGGTSADVGIITDGRQKYTTEFEIEWGLPAAVPLIDIKTIGAGGGSIAWVDAGGFLQVGPQSAGADPGPVCYGKGGIQPTVTDANLIMGRLDPDYFLAGRMPLDTELAYRRLEEMGSSLGMSALDLASSIVEIANENMANAIKMVSLERGHDPRRFALVAFGGAGPLHAGAIAKSLKIPQVIIPLHPGNFSAIGLLMADKRVDKIWTKGFKSTSVDSRLVNEQFKRIRDLALEDLRVEGFRGEPEIQYSINMRYYGQNYEHEVPLPYGEIDDQKLKAAFDEFNKIHFALYGYQIEG
ncbi:MAG: hydantoinase/oxoprolinase family protein, partial [Chloroflexi bacterium]|nr:hydantoinase/oxoprolinase family protein [Chloroflexota bacterium]